jgi:flagellar motility protein MotE (MotC chaperone)
MRQKNENIFLWILEQERQKNRARELKENHYNFPVHSSSFQQADFFNNEEAQENEEILSMLNGTPELEHLEKDTARLEEESQCLSEEQRRLNVRIKKLTRMLIQELRRRNAEKHHRINQLKARIRRLEKQFEELELSNAN